MRVTKYLSPSRNSEQVSEKIIKKLRVWVKKYRKIQLFVPPLMVGRTSKGIGLCLPLIFDPVSRFIVDSGCWSYMADERVFVIA